MGVPTGKDEGAFVNVGALTERPRADVGIGPYEPLGISLLSRPRKLCERPRNVR